MVARSEDLLVHPTRGLPMWRGLDVPDDRQEDLVSEVWMEQMEQSPLSDTHQPRVPSQSVLG